MHDYLMVLLTMAAISLIAFAILKPLALTGVRLPGCVLTLSILIVAGYWQFGGLSSLLAFRAAQEQEQKVAKLLHSNPGRAQLIAAIQERIRQEPDKEQGWYLLGRLYAGAGEWQKAQDAFSHARRLAPTDIAIVVNYAQSLWQGNGQRFDQMIRSAFQEILEQQPGQPDALAMLAMDAYQQQLYTKAIAYWEKLLPSVPPGSKDADAVRQAIAKAQARIDG